MTTTPTTPVRPATISKQLTALGYDRQRVLYSTGFRVKAWTVDTVRVSYTKTTGSYGLDDRMREQVNQKVERMRLGLIALGYTCAERDGWTFIVTGKAS